MKKDKNHKKQVKKSKLAAVTAFVLGLTFWIPLINLISGALAIIIGFKALIKIKKEPAKYNGKWFAIIGIVLGALPILLGLIGAGMCIAGQKEICKNVGLSFLGR